MAIVNHLRQTVRASVEFNFLFLPGDPKVTPPGTECEDKKNRQKLTSQIAVVVRSTPCEHATYLNQSNALACLFVGYRGSHSDSLHPTFWNV